MQLTELATYLKAELVTPADYDAGKTSIEVVSPIQEAKKGAVTFLANPEYAKYVKTTAASAIIMKAAEPDCPIPQLIHPNPYLAFAKTAALFYRPSRTPEGISDKAFIAEDAEVGEGVTIYPSVFVGNRAKLGANVVLYPGVSIDEDVEIGEGTIIYSNSVVYHACKIGAHCIVHAGCIIGADGFGFAIGDGEIHKIPQVGNVVIEDNVELGAGCTVDRAAMGSTVISSGCKLDNRVQVAHNCKVGKNCMISASVGLAGSAKLGDWVIIGGHSAVNGHIEIASQTRIGAMTGVIKNVSEPDEVIGFPAISAKQWRRRQVYLKRLGEYERRLKELETKLSVKT